MERDEPNRRPETDQPDRSPLDDETPGSQGEVDPGSEGDFGGEPAGEPADENAADTLSRMPPR